MRLLWLPIGVVLLPLHLVWLFCVLTVRLLPFLTRRIESTYRTHGWRGFTRFRLSHFLIATSIVAALSGLIGQRYVREWELQREAQRIYDAQLPDNHQRTALERAAQLLGGTISWHGAPIPEPFLKARRRRSDRRVFDTCAAMELRYDSYMPGRPDNWLPSQDIWETNFSTLLHYHHLESISIYRGSFEPARFENLPVSDSLEAIQIMYMSLPDEGWEWCARSPDLRYLHYRPNRRKPADERLSEASLRALSQSPKLNTLILDGVEITAEGAAAIAEMKELRHLYLRTVKPLDAEALHNLAGSKLQRLSLEDRPVTDEFLEALAKAYDLDELIVDDDYENRQKLLKLQQLLPDTEVRGRRGGDWPIFGLSYGYLKRRSLR